MEKPNLVYIRFSSEVFTSLALSLLLLKIAYLDWRLSSAVHSIPFMLLHFDTESHIFGRNSFRRRQFIQSE